MPSIKASHLLACCALALALTGCGEKNDLAVFSPESGHGTGWPAAHKAAALVTMETCKECHADEQGDLATTGGKSKISCVSCHMGGVNSAHPVSWGGFSYARHKTYSTAQRTVACANAACHGAALGGGAVGPSCTTCHLGGIYKKHPADWTSLSSHKLFLNTAPNNTSSCKTEFCHGTDGKGVIQSGPACDQCHGMK